MTKLRSYFSHSDISDLLQLIAQKYGDLDIQDRARFYHQLLLTVSGEKVHVDVHTYVYVCTVCRPTVHAHVDVHTCVYVFTTSRPTVYAHVAVSDCHSGFRLISWIKFG